MPTEIEAVISEKIKDLSAGDQEEVLKLVETKIAANQKARPIWERIVEMSAEIPDEEWAKLPSDGSVNHDHYLYGAPKKY